MFGSIANSFFRDYSVNKVIKMLSNFMPYSLTGARTFSPSKSEKLSLSIQISNLGKIISAIFYFDTLKPA